LQQDSQTPAEVTGSRCCDLVQNHVKVLRQETKVILNLMGLIFEVLIVVDYLEKTMPRQYRFYFTFFPEI